MHPSLAILNLLDELQACNDEFLEGDFLQYLQLRDSGQVELGLLHHIHQNLTNLRDS